MKSALFRCLTVAAERWRGELRQVTGYRPRR
jgi:hypothetical protein